MATIEPNNTIVPGIAYHRPEQRAGIGPLPPPLCVDCLHYRRAKGAPDNVESDTCAQPDLVHIDLVRGTRRTIYCTDQRMSKVQECGREGKLFEKAKPF